MPIKKRRGWSAVRKLKARREINLKKVEVLAELQAYVKKYQKAPHAGGTLGMRIKNLYGMAPSSLLYLIEEAS